MSFLLLFDLVYSRIYEKIRDNVRNLFKWLPHLIFIHSPKKVINYIYGRRNKSGVCLRVFNHFLVIVKSMKKSILSRMANQNTQWLTRLLVVDLPPGHLTGLDRFKIRQNFQSQMSKQVNTNRIYNRDIFHKATTDSSGLKFSE